MPLGSYVGFIGGNAQIESGTYADLVKPTGLPRTFGITIGMYFD